MNRCSEALLPLVGVALFLGGAPRALDAVRHPEAPPAAHTGGFGEPSCTACHSEYDVDLPGGALTVEGLPERWSPGRSYRLTVVLESEEMGAAGFQLSLRHPDGRPAGTLEPGSARVGVAVRTASDSAGVFAHHTLEGSAVEDPSRATWPVLWRAPAAGSGEAVVVHAAANSANGDNSPFGDLVYLFSAQVPSVSPSRALSR